MSMEVNWTIFHQNKVNCFIKNGEEYILLPQLLQTSFHQYSREEIETACGVLNIKLLLTNVQELNALKAKKVIRLNHDKFIGLIRRSDAERLLKLLDQKGLGEPSKKLLRGRHVPVQHNCFGTQNGVLWPHLYIDSDSGCIVCETCNQLFTPPQFVGHIHKPVETSVIHWGFDSSNWRLYLCVNPCNDNMGFEYSDLDLARHSELLEECKARHFQKELEKEICLHRRAKLAIWQPSNDSGQLTEVPPPPPSMLLDESCKNGQFKYVHRERKISLCDSTVPIPCSEASNLPPNFVPNISLKSNSQVSVTSCVSEDDDEEQTVEKVLKLEAHCANELSLLNTYTPTKHILDGIPKARVSTQDISHSERQYTNAQLALVKAIFSIDSSRPSANGLGCSTISRHLLQLFEEVKQCHQAFVAVLQNENNTLRNRLTMPKGVKNGEWKDDSVSTTDKACPKIERHSSDNSKTPYLCKLQAKYMASKNELERANKELESLKRKSSHANDMLRTDSNELSCIPTKRIHVSQSPVNNFMDQKGFLAIPHLLPGTIKQEICEQVSSQLITSQKGRDFLPRKMKMSPDSTDATNTMEQELKVMPNIRHSSSACA